MSDEAQLLGLFGDNIETLAYTVEVTHHVIRVTGAGLVRQEARKSDDPDDEGLLLAVPKWSLPMWQRRQNAAGSGPLFASFTRELLDPLNVINRIAEATEAIGYDWVTSHMLPTSRSGTTASDG